jgi:hypothetical protein
LHLAWGPTSCDLYRSAGGRNWLFATGRRARQRYAGVGGGWRRRLKGGNSVKDGLTRRPINRCGNSEARIRYERQHMEKRTTSQHGKVGV